MEKPIIAVLCSRHGSGNDQYDGAGHAYCERIAQAGALPMLLPITDDTDDLERLLRLCSGVLLPGGVDVDPHFYRQEPLPQLGALDSALDRCWIAVVRMAKEMGLPMLGICRGTQLTNVALGGSLCQDISLFCECPLLHMQHHSADAPLHQVALQPDSRLARLLETDAVFTNSTHHQCVAEPAPGLRITARTSDGVPEGLESDDGQVLLVQWHPETLCRTDGSMLRLFTDLAARAAAYSAAHLN